MWAVKHNILVYRECSLGMAEIEEEFELSIPELEGYLVVNHSFPQFPEENILISADYSVFRENMDRTVFTVCSLTDVVNSQIITTKNIQSTNCAICNSSTDRKMKHVYSVNTDIKSAVQNGAFLNALHSSTVICDDCHTALRNDLFVGLSDKVKLTYTI